MFTSAPSPSLAQLYLEYNIPKFDPLTLDQMPVESFQTLKELKEKLGNIPTKSLKRLTEADKETHAKSITGIDTALKSMADSRTEELREKAKPFLKRMEDVINKPAVPKESMSLEHQKSFMLAQNRWTAVDKNFQEQLTNFSSIWTRKEEYDIGIEPILYTLESDCLEFEKHAIQCYRQHAEGLIYELASLEAVEKIGMIFVSNSSKLVTRQSVLLRELHDIPHNIENLHNFIEELNLNIAQQTKNTPELSREEREKRLNKASNIVNELYNQGFMTPETYRHLYLKRHHALNSTEKTLAFCKNIEKIEIIQMQSIQAKSLLTGLTPLLSEITINSLKKEFDKTVRNVRDGLTTETTELEKNVEALRSLARKTNAFDKKKTSLYEIAKKTIEEELKKSPEYNPDENTQTLNQLFTRKLDQIINITSAISISKDLLASPSVAQFFTELEFFPTALIQKQINKLLHLAAIDIQELADLGEEKTSIAIFNGSFARLCSREQLILSNPSYTQPGEITDLHGRVKKLLHDTQTFTTTLTDKKKSRKKNAALKLIYTQNSDKINIALFKIRCLPAHLKKESEEKLNNIIITQDPDALSSALDQYLTELDAQLAERKKIPFMPGDFTPPSKTFDEYRLEAKELLDSLKPHLSKNEFALMTEHLSNALKGNTESLKSFINDKMPDVQLVIERRNLHMMLCNLHLPLLSEENFQIRQEKLTLYKNTVNPNDKKDIMRDAFRTYCDTARQALIKIFLDSMNASLEKLKKLYPPDAKIITQNETILCVLTERSKRTPAAEDSRLLSDLEKKANDLHATATTAAKSQSITSAEKLPEVKKQSTPDQQDEAPEFDSLNLKKTSLNSGPTLFNKRVKPPEKTVNGDGKPNTDPVISSIRPRQGSTEW